MDSTATDIVFLLAEAIREEIESAEHSASVPYEPQGYYDKLSAKVDVLDDLTWTIASKLGLNAEETAEFRKKVSG